MYEINHQLSQLPRAVRLDVEAHAGQTSAMTPAQLAAHYRAVAQRLIEQKRSRYQPMPPGDEMARTIIDMLQGNDLSFIGGPAHQPFPRWVTHQLIELLQGFISNLAPIQARLEQEARQRALQAAQEVARLEAQRQAEDAERRRVHEEAVRQLAQRQAEEAARLAAEHAARQLAQRQAEEATRLAAEQAARQLAQQAEEATRLAAEQAARQLARHQAEAAAQALAQREADEFALYEARLALELVATVSAQPVEDAVNTDGALIASSVQEKVSAHEILFVPGPAAVAEIDRATLVLKHSIEAAVTQYASAISPHLNTPKSFASVVY